MIQEFPAGINSAKGRGNGQPAPAFLADPVLMGQYGTRGKQVGINYMTGGIHRTEPAVYLNPAAIDGMPVTVKQICPVPLSAFDRLRRGQVENSLADSMSVRMQAISERSNG